MIIPPTLPTAVTVNAIFTVRHLRTGRIFYVDPPHVGITDGMGMIYFSGANALARRNLRVLNILSIVRRGKTVDFKRVLRDHRRLILSSRGDDYSLLQLVTAYRDLQHMGGQLLKSSLSLGVFRFAK